MQSLNQLIFLTLTKLIFNDIINSNKKTVKSTSSDDTTKNQKRNISKSYQSILDNPLKSKQSPASVILDNQNPKFNMNDKLNNYSSKPTTSLKKTEENCIPTYLIEKDPKAPAAFTFHWGDAKSYASQFDIYDDAKWGNMTFDSRWGNQSRMYDHLKFPKDQDEKQSAGLPISDPYFPPVHKTLVVPEQVQGANDSNWVGMQADIDTFKFQRPSQIYGDSNQTFLDNVSSHHINQGANGDCQLMVVLSSLALHPERLQRIFNEKQIQPSGLYSVNLMVDGIPQRVFVDDQIVQDPAMNAPAYNFSSSPELWGSLLEKVWAKLQLQQNSLDGGMEGEAFRLYTGFPFRHQVNKVHGTDQAVQDWATILNAYNKKFAMFTGSNSVKQNGTSDFHAQGITFVGEVDGHKVLQVKNPWGKVAFEQEDSSKFPPMKKNGFKEKLELKMAAPLDNNKDDGLFFIEYDEFKAHFDDLSISIQLNNATHKFFRMQDQNTHWFKISLNQDQDIAIMLSLTIDRMERQYREPTNYEYKYLFYGNGYFHEQNQGTDGQNDMFQEDLPTGDQFFGIKLTSCKGCDFNLHRYVLGVWGYSFEFSEITENYLAKKDSIQQCCTTEYAAFLAGDEIKSPNEIEDLYNSGELDELKSFCLDFEDTSKSKKSRETKSRFHSVIKNGDSIQKQKDVKNSLKNQKR